MNYFFELVKKHRERAQIITVLLLVTLVALWIFQKPTEPKGEHGDPQEMGVDIPKGYLIVPLELTNSRQISAMISRYGVLDVFENRENRLLAKNLHVLKIPGEDTPTFGALVPEEKSRALQILFSNKNLSGALKTANSSPAEFYLKPRSSSQITTYLTEDTL